MAGTISEFDGTGPDDSGNSGNTGPIDPAALTPVIGDAPGTADDYVRDDAGNIKRNKDGSPRRKRGRKAGTHSGTRTASDKDALKRSIDALSNILLVSHMGMAGAFNVPEIALDKDDADLLANSTVPVLELMDFAPDPRFVAVFGMCAAFGKVYGPKVYLYRSRKETERANRARPVNGFEQTQG